ncbi:MAG: ABC transporter permease [Bacteroidetes bacterium]|nr:ABC transporter permease [Bacteroidota bacterium]
MFKLYCAILKEFRILIRDKAALTVMFAMPILLVIVITSIQHSTFKMVNDNKVPLLFCNRDGGESSNRLLDALKEIGMFDVLMADSSVADSNLTGLMHQHDALIAIVVPTGFSQAISVKAKSVTDKALTEFGMEVQKEAKKSTPAQAVQPVTMFYNPVLQESFRLSVQGALQSAQQFTENREVLQALYRALSNKPMPDSLEQQILRNQSLIKQVPVAKDGSKNIPNATQHNVPAWTIFAMFFIVVSLSTNVVKEKQSGSFIRLKTLPTSYALTLAAKQITYLFVTLLQVLVIFSLGIFLFPHIGLPILVLPSNLLNLFAVSVICGWCAVSYGVLLGVFAKTLEQAIGFGAVSVVILAAIGGIVVPAFAMPESLQMMMKISPLHWCMEAYSTLFLEGGNTKDVLHSLFPLLVIIIAMQSIAFAGLKKQRLI